MQKTSIFVLTVFFSIIIAGIYGILHDELTYTISHEYYTKFKFIQFQPWIGNGAFTLQYPRISVAVVGFLATWWTGLYIGFAQGLIGYIHKDPKVMMNAIRKAILITIIVAFSVGLYGLFYGKLHLTKIGVNWYLPDNLIEKENFIAVGSMHNFSYLGGLLGLVAGIIYQIIKKIKTEIFYKMTDTISKTNKSLTGYWKGKYTLGPEYGSDAGITSEFTFDITDNNGEIIGISNEPELKGLIDDQITITGFFEDNILSFIKHYPYTFYSDESGKIVVDKETKHPEIEYTGEYNKAEDKFYGSWMMIIDTIQDSERTMNSILTGTWEISR